MKTKLTEQNYWVNAQGITNLSLSDDNLIKVWIEKGMTNSEIAQEIGYSESLVRHETIEIYAKLNVSGRKELLNEEK